MRSIGEGRRRCAAAAVAGVLVALAHAGTARAQEMTMCQSVFSPTPVTSLPEFQAALGWLHFPPNALEDAAGDALGAQYGIMWINDQRGGWSVAVTPGLLDLDTARAAIQAALTARLTPEQAAFVNPRLSVWPTPYGEPALGAVLRVLMADLQPLDQGWGLDGSIQCVPADSQGVEGWRATAAIYTGDAEPSPELVARAAAVAALFGDRVRVTVAKGDHRAYPVAPGEVPAPPAVLAPATLQPPGLEPPATPRRPSAAPKISRYVSLPRTDRCVRGRRITVRARRVADLRRLTVVTASHRAALRPGKRLHVRLTGRRTRLKVTVATRDGRSASRVYTVRRCSAR